MVFSVKVSLLFITIPSNLTLETLYIRLFNRDRRYIGGLFTKKFIHYLYFVHIRYHFVRDGKKNCLVCECLHGVRLPFRHVLIVVSSIYLCTAHGGYKSLIGKMKRRGPSHDPCGAEVDIPVSQPYYLHSASQQSCQPSYLTYYNKL